MGCDRCWSAEITNAFGRAYPDLYNLHSIETSACMSTHRLPAIGEYMLLSEKRDCPVAVCTLASLDLVERLHAMHPPGLSIVGKLETENIGIEKVVRNVLHLKNLRTFILCGADSKGHMSGDALLALHRNGMDAQGRIIGAKGKNPVLANLTAEEVKRFQNRVQGVNLIGCEDLSEISEQISQLASQQGV